MKFIYEKKIFETIRPSDVYPSQKAVAAILPGFKIVDFRPPFVGELAVHSTGQGDKGMDIHKTITSFSESYPRFIVVPHNEDWWE